MKILCVGVNHQSAPLEVRQSLAFDRASTARALANLGARFPSAEFVILSTCNRVEVYCAAPADEPPDADQLLADLADFHQAPLEELGPLAYRLGTEDAVRHLFEVASSLDSMVVGESQILSQAKEAFVRAADAQATGKYLNRLFHRAFGTAKRVHAATDIGRRHTSVAAVAVDFASRIFSDLGAKRVLVLGAGEMAERAVVHLRSAGCRDLTVVNRTEARAAALAAPLEARARPWGQLDDALAECDIVIASTASAEPVLTVDRMTAAHRRRRYANWLLLDLAVPRDIHPDVGRLRNVYLYDVDALGRVASEHLSLRQREADRAADIVADEVRAFIDWFEVRDVGPFVERLEARLHALGDDEVERLFKRLPPETTDRTRDEIRLATHRIVHKLLHEPIERLKDEAKGGRAREAMDMLRRLFGLDDDRDDR